MAKGGGGVPKELKDILKEQLTGYQRWQPVLEQEAAFGREQYPLYQQSVQRAISAIPGGFDYGQYLRMQAAINQATENQARSARANLKSLGLTGLGELAASDRAFRTEAIGQSALLRGALEQQVPENLARIASMRGAAASPTMYSSLIPGLSQAANTGMGIAQIQQQHRAAQMQMWADLFKTAGMLWGG